MSSSYSGPILSAPPYTLLSVALERLILLPMSWLTGLQLFMCPAIIRLSAVEECLQSIDFAAVEVRFWPYNNDVDERIQERIHADECSRKALVEPRGVGKWEAVIADATEADLSEGDFIMRQVESQRNQVLAGLQRLGAVVPARAPATSDRRPLLEGAHDEMAASYSKLSMMGPELTEAQRLLANAIKIVEQGSKDEDSTEEDLALKAEVMAPEADGVSKGKNRRKIRGPPKLRQ